MAQNRPVSFCVAFMFEEVQNNHIVTLLHFLFLLWKPHIDLYEVTDSPSGIPVDSLNTRFKNKYNLCFKDIYFREIYKYITEQQPHKCFSKPSLKMYWCSIHVLDNTTN